MEDSFLHRKGLRKGLKWKTDKNLNAQARKNINNGRSLIK